MQAAALLRQLSPCHSQAYWSVDWPNVIWQSSKWQSLWSETERNSNPHPGAHNSSIITNLTIVPLMWWIFHSLTWITHQSVSRPILLPLLALIAPAYSWCCAKYWIDKKKRAWVGIILISSVYWCCQGLCSVLTVILISSISSSSSSNNSISCISDSTPNTPSVCGLDFYIFLLIIRIAWSSDMPQLRLPRFKTFKDITVDNFSDKLPSEILLSSFADHSDRRTRNYFCMFMMTLIDYLLLCVICCICIICCVVSWSN